MAVRKGIILAGGNGSRLYPATKTTSKQLLPLYDKPMIYYPLATLIEMGIRELLIISTPKETSRFEALIGSGSPLGLNIEYAVQEKPEGIAQALIIAGPFVGNDNVALILGDNLFYGNYDFAAAANNFESGAMVFCHAVTNPGRYGVITFDDDGAPVSIVEKPINPTSNYAVSGLYLFDRTSIVTAESLKPSPRGEYEIADVIAEYLSQGSLTAVRLDRDMTWLDAGTHDSLLAASKFVASIEQRQGMKIGCIEEAALIAGSVKLAGLRQLVDGMPEGQYRNYLERVIRERE